MDCLKCCQNNKEKFNQDTCVFACRRDLVVFLLNVSLNIKKHWERYCYCKTAAKRCLVCEFRLLYQDDEYQIYKNCFDLHYLAVFYRNMYDCLEELSKLNNHLVCNLLFSKSCYTFDDWFTGQKNVFVLDKVVGLFEEK